MESAIEQQVRPAVDWPDAREAAAESPAQKAYSQPPRTEADRRFEEKLPGMLCAADAAVILLAGLAVPVLEPASSGATMSLSAAGLVCAALMGVNCLAWCGAYRRDRLVMEVLAQPTLHLARMGVGWGIAVAILGGIGLLQVLGRGAGSVVPEWLVATALLAVAGRMALRSYLLRLKRAGHLTPTLAIVGNDVAASDLIAQIETDLSDSRVLGVFFDAREAGRNTGTIDELVALARTTYLDEIRVVLAARAGHDCAGMIRQLSVLPVDITMDLRGVVGSRSGPFVASRVPPAILLRRPLSGWNATIKRAEDLVIGSLLLLLVGPLFLLIMIGIKLDSAGPVFFRQQRFGFNNNRIMVWKFRTMYVDSNPDPTVPQAKRNDSRITRLGSFLRRTSLDELPQLLNVLWGEMSLVGPRPHASAHNEKYGGLIDGYLARHRVKPGITGWAQVSGLRGETATLDPMRRRLEHDLYYIENWSLLFDLKIILRTIPAMISGENAY